MGHTVDFSPQALSDLEAIVSEIAKDDPFRAEGFGIELVEKTNILEEFPKIGAATPEFGDELIRELHHQPYRIIYLIREREKYIDILRYWHTSRGFLTLKP